jgi:hypothetical protein
LKTQSSRWQQLAKKSDTDFDKTLADKKSKVANAATSAPRHTKSEYTGEGGRALPSNQRRDIVFAPMSPA